MGNLSQIAQDLEIYCSQEFGLFELGDRHSRASALMPQKKNPYALAAIRTQAAVSAGAITSALVAIHTGSARTDHFHLLNGSVPAAIDEAAAITSLTAGVLADITVHVDRFAATARESFIVAADVCDVLAMESGIDHRTAHKVIGLAVRRVVDAGLEPDDLDDAADQGAFGEVVGRPLDGEVDVARALDPAGCVAARTQAGSCAPARGAADGRGGPGRRGCLRRAGGAPARGAARRRGDSDRPGQEHRRRMTGTARLAVVEPARSCTVRP